MAHAIWVGSRNIGFRYFALCIGDKAMKGRLLPVQRKTPKEIGISAHHYGLSFFCFFFSFLSYKLCKHDRLSVAAKLCTRRYLPLVC